MLTGYVFIANTFSPDACLCVCGCGDEGACLQEGAGVACSDRGTHTCLPLTYRLELFFLIGFVWCVFVCVLFHLFYVARGEKSRLVEGDAAPRAGQLEQPVASRFCLCITFPLESCNQARGNVLNRTGYYRTK